MKKFISAIIVSAGNSTRMGGEVSKQFLSVGGAPVIAWTLMAFERCSLIDEIIVSARRQDINEILLIAQNTGIAKLKTVVCGGEARKQSVLNGINAASGNSDFFAIHDGARPLILPETIEKTVLAALKTGAAAAGVPVKDTLKRVNNNNDIIGTQDRSFLWAVHTPQVFARDLYMRAVNNAQKHDGSFTDDCMLVEAMGITVKMVLDDSCNLKITTPDDLYVADAVLQSRKDSVS